MWNCGKIAHSHSAGDKANKMKLFFCTWLCLPLLFPLIVPIAVDAEGITACKVSAAENDGSCMASSPKTKVYVYQDEVFHHRSELERCDPGGLNGMSTDFKHSLGDVLLDHLTSGKSSHVVVTNNPDEADWFYVPFNVDRSQGKHVMTCGQNHLSRLNKVLNALQESPYYRQYKGADHVWYLGGWELTTAGIGILPYFPYERELIHNMTILNYLDRRVHLPNTQLSDDNQDFGQHEAFNILHDVRSIGPWWRQGQDHRCTINVPYRSHPAIGKYHVAIAEEQQTLDDWEKARPFKLHFVGVGHDYKYHPGQAKGVQALVEIWHKVAQILPQDKVFNTEKRLAPEEFADSLSKSQFCIMIRGDDPTRSRFYDAISAGCIPIVISDGFFSVGLGYGRLIHNYDTFTIAIPESNWLLHGPSILMYSVTMPRAELRVMHKSLMDVRPKLLFHINDGKGEESSEAAEYIFQALNERCKLDENELQEYHHGVEEFQQYEYSLL